MLYLFNGDDEPTRLPSYMEVCPRCSHTRRSTKVRLHQ